MARLTKRFIDTISPEARDQFFWDDDLSGFGLRVKPSGVISYLLQYRTRSTGASRRLTLGRHGPLTPEAARRLATIELGKVAEGRDPAGEKKRDRGAITVKELCDRYIAEAEKGHVLTRRKRPKKVSTLATDRGRILRHIVPLLGRKRLDEMSSADVRRFLRDVTDGKTAADIKTGLRGRAIVEGGRGAAARTVGLLGGIFSWGVTEGLLSDNPVHGVARPADESRDRVLAHEEWKALGLALAAFEQEGHDKTALDCIRLVALTGMRKSEALPLMTDHVDLRGSAMRLSDTKSGGSIRPIGLPAKHLLEPRCKTAGVRVFPGLRNGAEHIVGVPAVLDRVVERAQLPGRVTLHTLRHSFATIADELGLGELTIAAMLGHRAGSVTAKYVHQIDPVLVAAANRVSTRIDSLMRGTAPDADVIDFRSKEAV